MDQESFEVVKYDGRLALSFDFVSKILGVTREDFATLALANLLDEELDWIKHNGFDTDPEKIQSLKETINNVKFEADGWVINKRT
jgi:hypothetical protein